MQSFNHIRWILNMWFLTALPKAEIYIYSHSFIHTFSLLQKKPDGNNDCDDDDDYVGPVVNCWYLHICSFLRKQWTILTKKLNEWLWAELTINWYKREGMTDLEYKNIKIFIQFPYHIIVIITVTVQINKVTVTMMILFFLCWCSCSIYLYLCIIKSVIMCISFSLFYGCHYDARPSRHELVQRKYDCCYAMHNFFAWTTTTDARIVGHVYKNWMNFGGKNRKYNWSFCESSSSATLFSVMWSRPFVYGTLLFGEENPNHAFWIMGCA